MGITVLVTTGISNARRTGDKADIQELLGTTHEVGTINLILIFSTQLTDAAMVEAMMIASEGKAAALHNANILSPVSGLLATGTGTDAIAVICSSDDSQKIKFCGKHVLLGEWIGRLVIRAVPFIRSIGFSRQCFYLMPKTKKRCFHIEAIPSTSKFTILYSSYFSNILLIFGCKNQRPIG